MKYYSLNDHSQEKSTVNFREAMIRGLAPDRGLYFPEKIPQLEPDFLENLPAFTIEEIAYRVISPFIGKEIDEEALRTIVKETLNFDIPLVSLGKDIHTLELFHGPTMAFKDVGARFMARCLGYFNKDAYDKTVKVLVATSGDTGGAVANGFLGVPGVEVIILYPDGMVSDIQERQLTTLGQNITALKVKGNFDDCQRMVKTAFLDDDLRSYNLTSANSINVARWLPQMFYYFLAIRQLQENGNTNPVLFSVPSGNFGNICAGILASKMGLKIDHFVAATNINDTIPRYLKEGIYQPETTRATIANAMDVSDPSNFVRIEKIYGKQLDLSSENFSSRAYTDDQTRAAMSAVLKEYDYITDPHGAIGYLGARDTHAEQSVFERIFLETAHPVKFKKEVESTLKRELSIPEQISSLMTLKKDYVVIDNYEQFKSVLMKN